MTELLAADPRYRITREGFFMTDGEMNQALKERLTSEEYYLFGQDNTGLETTLRLLLKARLIEVVEQVQETT